MTTGPKAQPARCGADPPLVATSTLPLPRAAGSASVEATERAGALRRDRIEGGGRSLGLAAIAVAVAWVALAPLDWGSTALAPAGAVVAGLARLLVGASLAWIGSHLWRRSSWLWTRTGEHALVGVSVLAAAGFLVVAGTRPVGFRLLDLSAALFGTAVLLFVPVPLRSRAAVVLGFYGAFLLLATYRFDAAVVGPTSLAANLAVAFVGAILGAAHLDRCHRTTHEALGAAASANEVLHREVARGEQLRIVLSRQATEDPLTGLMNRRSFFDAATQLAARDDERRRRDAAVVLDADRFKSINDTFGHAVGDEVLRSLGATLSDAVRDGDLVGRLGGEEFCLFLPGAGLEEATSVADRIRATIAGTGIDAGASTVAMTVSVGVAERFTGETLQEVIGRADAAMYRSKRAGGDRLHCDLPA